MIQKEKWRDTVDPYSVPYKTFELIEVLGYAHAGNDVFYGMGIHEGECIKVFIKVERQLGADCINEVRIIHQLPFEYIPQLIEYGEGEPRYIITKEAEGKRLSELVGENIGLESMHYMKAYGEVLAKFHGLKIEAEAVKHRRFFDLPPHDYFEKYQLEVLEDYLQTHQPTEVTKCFVHGDCHYANMLWKNGKVSCVLDYELAGYGIKEFDLAWAVFLRPGQKFLKTIEEIKCFLAGYQQTQCFNGNTFKYYYILIASYFYSMGDEIYRKTVIDLVNRVIDEVGYL